MEAQEQGGPCLPGAEPSREANATMAHAGRRTASDSLNEESRRTAPTPPPRRAARRTYCGASSLWSTKAQALSTGRRAVRKLPGRLQPRARQAMRISIQPPEDREGRCVPGAPVAARSPAVQSAVASRTALKASGHQPPAPATTAAPRASGAASQRLRAGVDAEGGGEAVTRAGGRGGPARPERARRRRRAPAGAAAGGLETPRWRRSPPGGGRGRSPAGGAASR